MTTLRTTTMEDLCAILAMDLTPAEVEAYAARWRRRSAHQRAVRFWRGVRGA